MWLSTSISLESLDQSSCNFVCRSPVAVAWSSSGSVALCYVVLLVLWMTSRLAVMGRMTLRGQTDLLLAVSYVRDRGRVWCLWMLVVIRQCYEGCVACAVHTEYLVTSCMVTVFLSDDTNAVQSKVLTHSSSEADKLVQASRHSTKPGWYKSPWPA